jgi:hypothetical protein
MAIPGPKKQGFELQNRVFKGASGASYIVHLTRKGSYHVFMEVEAEVAAEDCGAPKEGGPRTKWKAIWDRR